MAGTGIKIVVLNVGDADAIVVNLRRKNEHLVMLIDGGHSQDAEKVIEELDKQLADAGKRGPDIVLCTHYDADHIGGLRSVVNHYNKNIGIVVIHRITEVLGITHRPGVKKTGIFPTENDRVLGAHEFMDTRMEEDIDRVLESIRQERELIDLSNKLGILTKEPVAGKCPIPGWEDEISIIGPTEEYYRALFPARLDEDNFLKTEVAALQAERESYTPIPAADPCLALETAPKANVSPVNLNSAIVKVILAGKTFLFTGDAGIPSFQNIPSYTTTLKNIFWLKVPHHASRNNINRQLIELMSPQIAVVSGDRYVDEAVVGCLRNNGARVDITRDDKADLRYEW